MKVNPTTSKLVFVFVLLLCLTPFVDPPIALLLGVILAQTTGHPFISLNKKWTNWLLKSSVVGLGFGMNMHHAIEAGKEGFIFTISTILFTFLFGFLLGKFFKTDSKISYLISSGTGICGGSAIAAVAPIIKANDKEMSVALGTIFILNSIALFIFPTIGHWFSLSQYQFGVWSAIAIHDTSSVVGAAAKYGQEALQVATLIKLERALWIIPLTIVTMLLLKSKNEKINIPYFIFLFIGTMCFATYFTQFQEEYKWILILSKKGLTVTLFLIGSGLSLSTIKSVGIKPLLQATLLWVMISVLSLTVILFSQNVM